MIQSQAYAAYRAQGDDRTAGMPVSAAAKADAGAGGPSFASMVGGTAATAPSAALRNDPDARSASLSLEVTKPQSDEADGSSSASGSKESKHGGFWDFVVGVFDMLNPLEHIPVISTIYAKITGHKISPMARIAGDTLYGGPIGAALGVANVVTEKKTGKDIGENVMVMFSSKSKSTTQDDSEAVKMAVATAPKADISWDAPGAASTALAASPATKIDAASPAAKTVAAVSDADKNAHVSMLAQNPNIVRHFKTTTQNFDNAKSESAAGHSLAHPASPWDKAKRQAPAVYSAPAPAAVKSAVPTASATSPATVSSLNAALSAQETPAAATTTAAQNGPVPPQLIAQKMMSALDQYTAMKKGNMGPGLAAAN